MINHAVAHPLKRLLAYAIDAMIIAAATYLVIMHLIITPEVLDKQVVGMLAHGLSEAQVLDRVQLMVEGTFMLVGMVFTLLYVVGFEGSSFQATIGKMLLGVRVINTDGAKPSFAAILVRFISRIILHSVTLGLGLLVILFSKHNQGLHDKCAKTLVVNC